MAAGVRGRRARAAIIISDSGRVFCVFGRRQGVVELLVLGEMVRVIA